MREHTIVLVKPTGIGRVGTIIEWYQDAGLRVEQQRSLTLTPYQVGILYNKLAGQPESDELVATMSNEPYVALLLVGDDAIHMALRLGETVRLDEDVSVSRDLEAAIHEEEYLFHTIA